MLDRGGPCRSRIRKERRKPEYPEPAQSTINNGRVYPGKVPLIPPTSFLERRTSTPVTRRIPQDALRLVNQAKRVIENQPTYGETIPMLRQPPRIPVFAGSMTKGEVSFEAWKFKVNCLMKNEACSEDLLLQSIRRSLKDEPNKLIMHLGEEAT